MYYVYLKFRSCFCLLYTFCCCCCCSTFSVYFPFLGFLYICLFVLLFNLCLLPGGNLYALSYSLHNSSSLLAILFNNSARSKINHLNSSKQYKSENTLPESTPALSPNVTKLLGICDKVEMKQISSLPLKKEICFQNNFYCINSPQIL